MTLLIGTVDDGHGDRVGTEIVSASIAVGVEAGKKSGFFSDASLLLRSVLGSDYVTVGFVPATQNLIVAAV